MAKQVSIHQEDLWKLRINVDAILKDLSLSVHHTEGEFYMLVCPLHGESNPSLEVASTLITRGSDTFAPGYWHCFGCKQKGDIALLQAKMFGINYTQAKRQIVEKYCPELLSSISGGKKSAKESPLPADTAIGLWIENLAKNQPFLEYVNKSRGVSEAVMRAAKLGEDGIGHIMIPVYAADGKTLLNNRTYAATKEARDRGEPKIKGVSGRGVQVYPMWMVKKDAKRRVFTEGEWDALALHSIGETETLTTTGGTGTLKPVVLDEWYPTGKGSEVVICFDNDEAGKKAARKLTSELQAEGVESVLIVNLPDGQKDISDYLTSIPVEKRVEAWQKLTSGAVKRDSTKTKFAGIISENGCLVVEETGEIVAPFTGQVVSSGLRRFGFGKAARVFTIALLHRDGKTKLEVVHDYSEFLVDSIQKASHGGSMWAFERKMSDKVFTWLAQAGADTEVRKDVGYCFGFDSTIIGPDQFKCFYSPTTLFKPTGAEPNNEIVMEPPAEFLRKMDLPMPEHDRVQAGLKVTFEKAYRSHAISAMAPILAVTFMAPVFRAWWPNEARFPTLLYGQSGCGKTTRSIIALSYFGHFRSTNDLVTVGGRNGSGSTFNSVSTIQGFAGDSVFVIDDLGLSRTTDDKQREMLVDFLQSQSQGLGRTRMTSSGDIKSAQIPRGLPIISTEILPSDDESQVARAFLISMPSAVSLREEPFASAYQDCFDFMVDRHHAMAGWIEWNVSSPAAGVALSVAQSEAKAMIEKIASSVSPNWRSINNAPRIVGRWTSVTECWFMLLEFAHSKGVLTTNDVADFKEEWRDHVVPLNLFAALGFLVQSGHRETFMSSLVMSMQSGKAALLSRANSGLIPTYSQANSVIIGVFDSIANMGCDSEDAVTYLGNKIVVTISSSAVTALSSGRGSVSQWKTIVQFLKASDYVSRSFQTNAREIRLSKKGALELLSWLPGITV